MRAEWKYLAEQVLEANLALPRLNLVAFTWGNVSAADRTQDLAVIKPSGVPYEDLTLDKLVCLRLSTGEVINGDYKPSSDTETHLHHYREFPQIGAVVHTHSRHASAWAQACRNLPAYGTTHADYFHGPVPCTRKLRAEEMEQDYELNTGRVIVETFRDRSLDPVAVPGVLVAGHGCFTWGTDAEDSVYHAAVLEEIAYMALHTEQINPQVKPIEQELLDVHYYRKHGKDAYYGQ